MSANDLSKGQHIYSEENWAHYRPLRHFTSQWHAFWMYPIYQNTLFSLRKVRSKPLESHITDTKMGLQSRQKDVMIDGIKAALKSRSNRMTHCFSSICLNISSCTEVNAVSVMCNFLYEDWNSPYRLLIFMWSCSRSATTRSINLDKKDSKQAWIF